MNNNFSPWVPNTRSEGGERIHWEPHLENFAPRSQTRHSPFRCNGWPSLPFAAIVAEARRSAPFKLEHGNGRGSPGLEARPERHLVFADSRHFAEEPIYRFLTQDSPTPPTQTMADT
jgi:hypothetical protein